MLQVKSFYLMSNFTRVTHEFLDDKINIKVKSLFTDYENFVKYNDIKHIQLVRSADPRWLWLGLTITMIPRLSAWIFPMLCWNFLNNPPFPLISRLIILAGIALCIPAFRKNEVYFFMDQVRNNVVSIKIDNKNRSNIHQAVELVRQKSNIVSDTDPKKPFPNSPLFEYVHYDITNFLNKSVALFFDDKFVFKDSSLVEDVVTEVDYDELNGKILRARTTDSKWTSVTLGVLLVYLSFYSSTYFMFPQFWQRVPSNLILNIVSGIAGLIFLLAFFKREVYLFYSTSDNIVYWTKPNQKNAKTLENIIEYVKSKTRTNESSKAENA